MKNDRVIGFKNSGFHGFKIGEVLTLANKRYMLISIRGRRKGIHEYGGGYEYIDDLVFAPISLLNELKNKYAGRIFLTTDETEELFNNPKLQLRDITDEGEEKYLRFLIEENNLERLESKDEEEIQMFISSLLPNKNNYENITEKVNNKKELRIYLDFNDISDDNSLIDIDPSNDKSESSYREQDEHILRNLGIYNIEGFKRTLEELNGKYNVHLIIQSICKNCYNNSLIETAFKNLELIDLFKSINTTEVDYHRERFESMFKSTLKNFKEDRYIVIGNGYKGETISPFGELSLTTQNLIKDLEKNSIN